MRFKDLERWDTTHNQSKILGVNSKSIDSVSAKYPLIALGEICETNRGLSYKPSNISKANKGFPVLRSNNIQNGKIDYNNLVFVDMNVASNKIANKGDLIMCVNNGSADLIGKTAMVEKDGMSFGSFMAIIRSKYNPFIYHFLQTDFFRNFVSESRTSGIYQISQNDIKNFKIPLPPLETQKEIVLHIEQKTSQIQEMAQKRRTLQSSIESKLQEMLTN